MAQFFNFKEDYFGLNDKDIQRNTELYGLNIYTQKEKEKDHFEPARVILSPAVILMCIAGILRFFTNIFTGILILVLDAA